MHQATIANDLVNLRYDLQEEVALVVAEPGPARGAACLAANQAGFRVRAPVDAAEALADNAVLDGVHLLLIESAGIDADLLDPLLLRLGAIAEDRRMPLIATVLPEQLDGAAALLPLHAALQCRPSDADRLGAAIFARSTATRLNDSVGEDDSLRMRRFQEEVARIADSLARLTRDAGMQRGAAVRNDTLVFRSDARVPDVSAQDIRRVIRARRLRSDFFQGDLFADPAWDMLLDLFASELEYRKVSVSSLCIAAAVPPTTALRWIGTLHEAGLFERHADPKDRRRAYIGLSAAARGGILDYVAAVQRAGLSLV
ncbi:winged helix DNA-binding protein [Sphingomonas sp. TDK1]|uniref:winged helix DNA-binding protein n=1 Tax=Sphingomonas sp. TDK1 TaxID=453247 RepID=UPI0007D9547D|nr:winged helix DNA-binding protein [Sphingomonas sp. TDK1]OAN64827.1 hypothetical protein A7X12_17475 [Sphingomonas sp. TDK1]